MLDIVICEDNEHQRNEFEKIIQNVIQQLNLNIDLSTSDPNVVIQHVKNSKKSNYIYFLDIDLGCNMNGIELAKIIRKIDPRGYIIFVTSHAELTLTTFQFKVQAFDYIMKFDFDNIDVKIRECIFEAHNQYKNANIKENNVITINSGSNIIKYNFDDILFFETTDKNHKIRVHTCNEQVEFYGTLKGIEEIAPVEYYKSHKAFLVNTKNIKSIDKDRFSVYMVNGEECYVSERYLKGLLKKWII